MAETFSLKNLWIDNGETYKEAIRRQRKWENSAESLETNDKFIYQRGYDDGYADGWWDLKQEIDSL